MAVSSDAIVVDGLAKTYRTPFRRKRVEAVRGVSFSVKRGEIFGFLGPNGAGKTTTIRMLMGLIKPSAGSASILGHQIPSREARADLGFLPEAPYFYDFLSVAELLDFTGRLFGLSKAERRKRADRLIELVNLKHARDNALKSYSKGMLQRAGIAQALMNDPNLVVFDEPMGGLDPLGRKEVREIILSLRDEGKTVFFSSHILADVESVADRVAILTHGKVRKVGMIDELVDHSVRGTELVLRRRSTNEATNEDNEAVKRLRKVALRVRERGTDLLCSLGPEADVNAVLNEAIASSLQVISVSPAIETLEDVFIRAAQGDLLIDPPSGTKADAKDKRPAASTPNEGEEE